MNWLLLWWYKTQIESCKEISLLMIEIGKNHGHKECISPLNYGNTSDFVFKQVCYFLSECGYRVYRHNNIQMITWHHQIE